MDKEDKVGKDVLEAVKETQQANRFILKRLNHLLQEPHNHCACSRLQDQSHKDIQELQGKVSEVVSELAKKDESHRQTSIKLEILKDRIYSLEESLMAFPTDDSKLRSASLRKELASELEDGGSDQERKNEQLTFSSPKERFDSDQTRRTSGVVQDNSVEYSFPLVSKNGMSKSNDFMLAEVRVKTDASTNIQKGAVGGVLLKADTCQTVIESSSMLISKPSDQSTTVPVSRPENITEETNIKKNSRQMSVEVVRSTEKSSFEDEQFWRYLANQEMENGKKTLKDLEGVHTVLCLDISESMSEGNAWMEATTFLEDYLKGLSDMSDRYGISNEYVALVTFGHVSRVQMRFTNKYSDIRELIGKQKLGGPSPLYAGLIFGLAAAGSSEHTFHCVNALRMFTKIIIVTDGHTTEVGQYAGPDTPEENMDETRAKILQCMEEYKNSPANTFCVPVGKADTQFLELMMVVADGRIISYRSGNRMAKRLYIATKSLELVGISGGTVTIHCNNAELSEEDRKILEELLNDSHKSSMQVIGGEVKDKYREIPDENVPPIGSRVRRGPDWMWNTQDSFGTGTVIGHDIGQVRVEWDADGHKNVYRYGHLGYDVLIVEEPRELKRGQKIAVGCVVKFNKGHQRQKGVVIKLDENNERATVRWNDGERGEYSCGGKGNGEIEVCSEFEPFTSKGYILGSGKSKVQAKQTKNKNKNVN